MYVDNFDDQMNELPEPSVFSISENLADIYQDLKNLLEIYKLGDENLSNDALSECYENFKNYWGFKLVSSIKILHLIKFSNYNSSEYFTKYNKDEWLINKAQKDFRKNE